MHETASPKRDIAILKGTLGSQLSALAGSLRLGVTICSLAPPSDLDLHDAKVALGTVGFALKLAGNRVADSAISRGPARGVVRNRFG
jgi:hypothetical protein